MQFPKDGVRRVGIFLSHLLIAGCNIAVQLSVFLSLHPSVHQGLSTINFSVPMIARIMKPCIVIVLDILYKLAP